MKPDVNQNEIMRHFKAINATDDFKRDYWLLYYKHRNINRLDGGITDSDLIQMTIK